MFKKLIVANLMDVVKNQENNNECYSLL